jgi:hypothetical protein
MATRTAVTRRNALDAQPVPGLASETSDARQRARTIRSDAAVAVTWLNEAHDARAMPSYQRVASIREDLEKLRSKREEVRETFGPNRAAWDATVERHQNNRARLLSAKRSGEPLPRDLGTTFPPDRRHTRETEVKYDESLRGIEQLASSLNARLTKYKFHPEVAYAYRLPGSFSVMQNLWAGGMVPDVKGQWFQTKLNGWTISEGDAALSLVRLDLSGELHKVALCGMCKKRWRVAAKSHYKFCSRDCREAYYAMSPDYLSRKRENQREFRKREKLKAEEALSLARVSFPKRRD